MRNELKGPKNNPPVKQKMTEKGGSKATAREKKTDLKEPAAAATTVRMKNKRSEVPRTVIKPGTQTNQILRIKPGSTYSPTKKRV
ncbi:hypothetical protein [Companilactobacillus zhongbaensis]|uniref:hypothetical protein n=1 Tax=Companilactobacillus zhongbaensis TaxID=2486009 RepID=UPI000F78A79F|nr:hypothetical protein [Companilactobacillus zhongbaensis]